MIAFRGAVLLSALSSALALASCSILSHDGPEGPVITAGAASTAATGGENVAYALVNLDSAALRTVGSLSSGVRRFSGWRAGAGSGGGDVSFGVGDIVSITIFEAESGGLFIPKDAASRPGNFVQLPNQQVDRAGNITVPYVDGPIHVAGRIAADVSSEVARKLKARAIEPQVIVSLVEHRGNDVSVLGEVATPTRFSLDPGGLRLTGAIARAGGPKWPAYETVVTVKRHGIVQAADMTAVVKDPSQDISMGSGDVIYLSHEPKVFLVLGATPSPGSVGGTNNRRFTFDNEIMTLAEAISKAGGLDDTRSDARDVFLFRFENVDVLRSLSVDVSPFPEKRIPTIYKVDFASADGFFLASKFDIRDKDVIFVASSASTDINKVLTIAVSASQTAYNVGNATYNFSH